VKEVLVPEEKRNRRVIILKYKINNRNEVNIVSDFFLLKKVNNDKIVKL